MAPPGRLTDDLRGRKPERGCHARNHRVEPMSHHLVLQPGSGPIPGPTYLQSTPENVPWGRLPYEKDLAVLTVDAGAEITVDTVSHEGILDNQGPDPAGFFGGTG